MEQSLHRSVRECVLAGDTMPTAEPGSVERIPSEPRPFGPGHTP